MRRTFLFQIAMALLLAWLLSSCGGKVRADVKAEAPPPAVVERESDPDLIKVDHPERFPVVAVDEYKAAPELNVTGTVSPDISRQIPAISLASGRVVEIHARLGDPVVKGQLLLRIQSADISQAFSEYRQALADETLAKAQLERARILYEKGAIAQKDLEVAQDTTAKATVTVETSLQRLRLLGADPRNPSSIVDVLAPASGVITDQQVTAASGIQGLASPNAFTISDLSHVWIVCDVYENDLSFPRVGELADIHLNAYPDLVLKGRVSNIGPVLDPVLRTAKVRLELPNPGMLRFGMFVRATFHGLAPEVHASVPASAVLHLHDRDWVYVPQGNEQFRRLAVTGGPMLADGRQEILSGIGPGGHVARDALILQNTAEQ